MINRIWLVSIYDITLNIYYYTINKNAMNEISLMGQQNNIHLIAQRW